MRFHPAWSRPLRTEGGFLLNRQNSLSMTKVICQQSLTHPDSSLWHASILVCVTDTETHYDQKFKVFYQHGDNKQRQF